MISKRFSIRVDYVFGVGTALFILERWSVMTMMHWFLCSVFESGSTMTTATLRQIQAT